MDRTSALRKTAGALGLALIVVLAIGVLVSGVGTKAAFDVDSKGNLRRPTGTAQLVSIEPLPQTDGEMCEWVAAGGAATMAQALAQQRLLAAPPADVPPMGANVDADRAPRRVIKDPYPSYSAVAVEPKSNMVVATDENIFRILEYNRLDNTPPSAKMTEPKRVVGGNLTKTEMMCAVYIDPATLDTYVVNNDTQDWLSIFSKNAKGNVPPDRSLAVPHGTFGIAVDEARQELFLTIQHQNEVIVYPKMASGRDAPLRELFGDDTGLEDPHGIALDAKNGLLFVSNHGTARYRGSSEDRKEFTPGTGKFNPPSIAVYAHDAKGNTAPLRKISGPKTTLNWPMLIAVDEAAGELYVANDMDHSVLVFKTTDDGDVAPTRIIKGSKTTVKNPTGVALDLVNKELWVANMGNHSITVFPLAANGNVAPLRTIRGGPSNELSLMIGNPGAVGYDTKREQILVPN